MLCDAPAPRGGDWGTGGNIIAELGYAAALCISSTGGAPQPFSKLQQADHETAAMWLHHRLH